nr:N-acetylserotonin O-methyltransferase-like protein [Equus caballus]
MSAWAREHGAAHPRTWVGECVGGVSDRKVLGAQSLEGVFKDPSYPAWKEVSAGAPEDPIKRPPNGAPGMQIAGSLYSSRLLNDVPNVDVSLTFGRVPSPPLWTPPDPLRDKAGGYGIQALAACWWSSWPSSTTPRARGPARLRATRPRRPARTGRTNTGCGPRGGRFQQDGAQPAPFPTGLLELVDSFKASKALFTACKLKVFDLLKDGAPLKAVDVAGKLGASACGTGRLLDACVALGFLQKTDRGYSNTETANLHLTSDGAYSLRGLVLHHSDHPWDLSARPESAGRDGVDPHDGALGERTGPPCQASCAHSEETRLGLLRAMHSLAKLTARHVATAFDLSRFGSACDLGGCTGALAYVLAREYPRLRVTVFDLPEVLQHVAGFQPDGPRTEQVSFLPGDFFEDSLPEADLYVVSRILRDWPDGKVHELLSRVARACKPGGGLLLVDVAAGPEAEAEAEGLRRRAGGERSAAVYAHLLRRLGFADVRAAGAGGRPLALLGTRGAP